MAEPVNNATDDERVTRLLAQFKADVLTLAQRGDYGTYGYVVIAGLLDVCEGLMRRSVRAEPDVMPNLLSRIDEMRAHVQAVARPPVNVPVGPMH